MEGVRGRTKAATERTNVCYVTETRDRGRTCTERRTKKVAVKISRVGKNQQKHRRVEKRDAKQGSYYAGEKAMAWTRPSDPEEERGC